MGDWKKTCCMLCGQNCGLEALVEENRIVKVRPDKANPRSEGYICRKGMNVANYQHHAQRLTHPLKRVGDSFEKISWDQALDEIAAKLRHIIDEHGPRAYAYMGGGGQGCHFEAPFGVTFMQGLGSQYHYSALAQELTGLFWVMGRGLGKQYMWTVPDEHETDLLLAIGWNGWMSHQMPQARRHLTRISKDPDKLLVVIDPRRSDIAQRADIHLPIRPGTDALLTRAMIAIILQEGWENSKYIANHVSGFDQIRAWFTDFDAKAAVEVCELDYEQVREVCRLIATRKSSMHADLGILMNRHSTVTSYLEWILFAICGRIGVRGGNVIPGIVMPIGAHSDERLPETWRTVATDFPAIMGYFPPNAMPEEILSGHPDRLRAVIIGGANPLRSYADTTAYEKAFAELDLLVTVEINMSETAALSHYVLPAPSGFEKWDGTFFPWTWPGLYLQFRPPVLEPEGEPLEEGEIYTRLAERLGLMPEIPDSLYEAAKGDRSLFLMALMGFIQENPQAMTSVPFLLAKLLGPVLGSAHKAALWGLLQTAPPDFRENAVRAGFEEGPALGEQVFQACLDHPEGLWVGKCDEENNLGMLKTQDGKVNVHIPELAEWLQSIQPASEANALRMGDKFPFILMAGRHTDMNANTLMRNPAWNEGRRACTLAMHPEDARALGLEDGQMVRATTEAGAVEVELEVTGEMRKGQMAIPHGFGLDYEGKPYGVNVNRLAKNTHRDDFAGTPLHRYVPCRVEALKA
jgi:anaerobic selenocysteine-containing dehydrogenase